MILGLWLLACADGGPVDGPADTHCEDGTPYDPPSFGTLASDADCRYQVEYKYSRASRHRDTSFELLVTTLADETPVTGADPRLDATLDGQGLEDHGAWVESGFGRYLVDGVRFGRPGRWDLRFEVGDPTASVAFWFDVP